MQSDDKNILTHILKEAAQPRLAASVKRALAKKLAARRIRVKADDENDHYMDG